MKSVFQRTACALAIACALPAASASVLTFDDLPGTGPRFFTSNYDGFMFGDNNVATNPWFYTDAVTDYNLPHSGAKYASTDFSLYANDGSYQPTQAIFNATPFIFNGAYFSDAPAFDTPDRIQYQLSLGGVVVYTSALSGPLGAPSTFVASGYSSLVDSVVIIGQQGYYAMDDFTYNEVPTVPAVPEPGTYALMAAGLGALGFVAKRRRKA